MSGGRHILLAFARKTALLLSLLVILIPTSAWSRNFFSWDADQASKTSWGPILKVEARTIVPDTIEKIQGTGSMRLDVPGDQQFSMGIEAGDGEAFSGIDGSTRYYRWWMKIDPSFNWGNGGMQMKAMRIKRLGDISPIIMSIFLVGTEVRIAGCAQCSQGEFTTFRRIPYEFRPTRNPAVTNWQEYIIELNLQNGADQENGGWAFGVNGVEIGRRTGLRFFSGSDTWQQAWGGAMSRPYPQFNDPAAGGIIWVDNFSVDDAFNSAFVKGDVTPPASPTGLRIQ